MTDPRQSRAWRKLRDQVVAEEPMCWLHFPEVCTNVSTTADHVLSVHARPDLAMVRSNLRGACDPCNRARGHTPADLIHITPPPALEFFGQG